MSVITPFPEAESPALERFAVLGDAAVAALLAELRDRSTPVTLYDEGGSGFAIFRVLDVDAAREAVVLGSAADAGPPAGPNRATGLIAVGFLDDSKIQFRLGAGAAVEEGGRAAHRFRLPARAFRIQRRTAPRRHPPGGRPALCRVPHPRDAASREPLRVLDIGIGGLALLATPPLLEGLARDDVLDPCQLDLPEIGQIAVTLKVRYLDTAPGAAEGGRCGCEFVGLGAGARRALQAYLDRLEDSRPPDTRSRHCTNRSNGSE